MSRTKRNQSTNEQLMLMTAYIITHSEERWTIEEWSAKIADHVGKTMSPESIRLALKTAGVEWIRPYNGRTTGGRHHDRVRLVAKELRNLSCYVKDLSRAVGYDRDYQINHQMFRYVITGQAGLAEAMEEEL